MSKVGGSGLAVDITAKDAPSESQKGLADRGLDIIVHNRRRHPRQMLRNMARICGTWCSEVNLASIFAHERKS